MTIEDFFEWAHVEFKMEMELMDKKGKEYTIGSEDKLKNFKSISERLKTAPEQVALVYLLKHIDSITNYCISGTEASDESIQGRLRDARNYLLLLGAIIMEREIDEGEPDQMTFAEFQTALNDKLTGNTDRLKGDGMHQAVDIQENARPPNPMTRDEKAWIPLTDKERAERDRRIKEVEKDAHGIMTHPMLGPLPDRRARLILNPIERPETPPS